MAARATSNGELHQKDHDLLIQTSTKLDTLIFDLRELRDKVVLRIDNIEAKKVDAAESKRQFDFITEEMARLGAQIERRAVSTGVDVFFKDVNDRIRIMGDRVVPLERWVYKAAGAILAVEVAVGVLLYLK